MRYHGLLALAALVSAPGVASAQAAPAPGSVPTLPLRPPVAVHHAPPAGQVTRWHVPPRPRGWVWGRPGWWGGSYQQPMRGYIMPSFWLSPDYVVPDWAGYGFAEPGRGRRWVRYYDDAVLVDGRGMIHDSVHDVSWGRYDRGPVPAYVGSAPDAPPPYGAYYDQGYQGGPAYQDYDDEVTWDGGSARSDRQIWAWPSQSASGQVNPVIVVPPGSTTTIVFQNQPVVTTTTTNSYQEPAARAWRPAPHVKEQPRSSPPPRVIGRVPVTKG